MLVAACVGGKLRTNRNRGGSGQVVEMIPAADDERLLVHAILAEPPRQATLVDCLSIQRQDVGTPFGAFNTQTLSPRYMVRGLHSSGNKQLYDAIRIRPANIDSWAGLKGFVASSMCSDTTTLTYKRPDKIEAATASGIRISLHESVSRSWPSVTGGHIERKVWIECSNFSASTYEDLQRRLVTPLISFLSMLVGSRSPLVEVMLHADDTWVRVDSANLARNASIGERAPHEILLPLSTIPFESLAKFVDVSEATGPLPPVIADAHGYLSQATLETQLLEFATVAEGLHRRIFEDESRMSSVDAGRLRTKLAYILLYEDQRIRDIIRGMLAHLEEVGYPKRLAALAKRVEIALPGVTGVTSKWIKAVNDARNSYAHRTSGYLGDESIDQFFAISSSLKWVLTGVCILESGIAEEVVARRVRTFPQYRQFLTNVADAAPSIYGSPVPD